MRVMVRTLRGDRVALDVDGATPVAQVKSMVMARERIPAPMQRLFFAGRHLDDDARTLEHYGVRHNSLVFLALRLRPDTAAAADDDDHPESRQQQPETHVVVGDHGRDVDDHLSGGDGALVKARRNPVSRRLLRKVLSGLHVDAWTSRYDAKFLDLLLRRTRGAGGERSVGELSCEDWSVVRDELNAATGSGFAVEELQRRLGEFRREFDAVTRIKNHPRFSYDARRRVVVAGEAEWKRYTLENPEAAAYEGRSPHYGRLRAIFSGNGGGGKRKTESPARRCLSKLLRSFGLRCRL